MAVNVQDKHGRPLASTNRFGKIRHLLDCGEAVVVSKDPFTVRLKYQHGEDYTKKLKS